MGRIKKVIIPVIAAVCLVPYNTSMVYADELNSQTSAPVVTSAGLICGYSVYISSSGNSLLFSGRTNCFDSMKVLGIKSIIVQRSSNNSSWSNYKTVNDITSNGLMSFSVTDKNIITVESGYYYRITCKHYAKEYGLFGSSESISNTSNSVYIP